MRVDSLGITITDIKLYGGMTGHAEASQTIGTRLSEMPVQDTVEAPRLKGLVRF